MGAKSQDAALFHKLINRHRGKLGVFLNELHVEESTYWTDDEILQGLRRHFGELAKHSMSNIKEWLKGNLLRSSTYVKHQGATTARWKKTKL